MSKPATLPSWATSGSAEVTVPSADKQAAGFVGDEEPPAGFLGWLFFWICQWLAYLSAGAFVGDVSVDGNFSATGNTLLSGTLTASHVYESGGWGQDVPILAGATFASSSCTNGILLGGSDAGWSWSSEHLGLLLRDGDTVLSVTADFTTKGIGTATVSLMKVDTNAGGTVTTYEDQTSTAVTPGTVSVQLVLGSPPVLSVGAHYYVKVDGPKNGDVVSRVYLSAKRIP